MRRKPQNILIDGSSFCANAQLPESFFPPAPGLRGGARRRKPLAPKRKTAPASQGHCSGN
ncbi:hypothetical protein RBY4I_3559 [Rhodobacterales bacterium Y4I]|nr:hypothetical protein RBY4I_3559 [Rhodobacterales bacterium Y4I]